MAALIFAAGWACAVAWLLLRAAVQFRAYEVVREPPDPGPPRLPPVSVIVAARNEAAAIGPCVEGLLRQDYPADRLEILVVDDGSTDGTAEIVRRIAGSLPPTGRPRLRILSAGPLPAGWTGKSHACSRGAAAASGAWLCFVDADTVAAPPLLRTAVVEAQERGTAFLSLEPFQDLRTFWERVVIPSGFLLIAFLNDLRAVNDPTASDAAGIGQCLLVRRDVYDAIGGHAAVRADIIEDTALARAAKRSGARIGLLGAGDLIRVRMYTGFWPLWEGFSKNAVEIAGGPGRAVSASVTGFLLAGVLVVQPLWAWGLRADVRTETAAVLALVLALSGSAALLATAVALARYFRVPSRYAFLLPLGFAANAAIVLNALRLRAAGRVRWKDRVYDAPLPARADGAPSGGSGKDGPGDGRGVDR